MMSSEYDKGIVEKDLLFLRKEFKELLEQGSEGIDLMIELAKEAEHPRAYEVLATMIKTNAEVAARLMDLHKTKAGIEAKAQGPAPIPLGQIPYVYTGDTTMLQRELKDIKVGETLEHKD
jgi:hypothetical protein